MSPPILQAGHLPSTTLWHYHQRLQGKLVLRLKKHGTTAASGPSRYTSLFGNISSGRTWFTLRAVVCHHCTGICYCRCIYHALPPKGRGVSGTRTLLPVPLTPSNHPCWQIGDTATVHIAVRNNTEATPQMLHVVLLRL